MQEIWKKVTIEPFSEYYEVSNLGRVRSVKRTVKCGKNHETTMNVKEKILSQQKINGYSLVHLFRNGKQRGFRVHRLVALAFIENERPDTMTQINHKDENKNNNRADNLEWCTASYNINYGTANKRRSAKLKGRENIRDRKPFVSMNEFGVVVGTYSRLEDVKADGFRPAKVQSALHGMTKKKRIENSNPEHRYKGRTWWYV
uniref:Homing endonuclease n=1 Tax=virus sp. ctqEG8 TaxID=2827998 RepID=A0A8S5RFR4_9VIRU|nr:MAG TPA: homing endonuclease [virus sp. ctqEG8]